MSLEADAMKDAPPISVPSRRPPRTFDRLVRVVATLLLFAMLSVVYWIPMQLLGGFAAAIVLAALTMVGAGVASRLYHLRIRVSALEAALDDADRRAPSAEPAAALDAEARHEQNRLEEVQKEP
jgi:hypothetical protein